MKTLSQHPLLVGQILARVEARNARAARRQRFCMACEDFVAHRPVGVVVGGIFLLLLAWRFGVHLYLALHS